MRERRSYTGVKIAHGSISHDNDDLLYLTNHHYKTLTTGGETMSGSEIRAEAKKHGVYLWQVAKAAGISEPTLTRWLRGELTPEQKEMLLMAIRKAAA